MSVPPTRVVVVLAAILPGCSVLFPFQPEAGDGGGDGDGDADEYADGDADGDGDGDADADADGDGDADRTCVPDAAQNRPCGLCRSGSQARTCGPDGHWGDWNECSDPAECSPGEAESQQCGIRDHETLCIDRLCGDNCLWGEWTECGVAC